MANSSGKNKLWAKTTYLIECLFNRNSIVVITLIIVFSNSSMSNEVLFRKQIDYVTSPIAFKNLVKLECNLVGKFIDFLKVLQGRNEEKDKILRKHVKRYVFEFDHTLLQDLDVSISIFHNFIQNSTTVTTFDCDNHGFEASKHVTKIFRTIRRFVLQLPKILELTKIYFLDTHEVLLSAINHNHLPDTSDLKLISLAVLRINQIYKIPFEDIANGRLSKIWRTKCTLSALHIFELAKVALVENLLSQAVDAAEYSVTKLRENEISEKYQDNFERTLKLDEALNFLEMAIKKHDSKLSKHMDFEDIQPASSPMMFNRPLLSSTHQNFTNRSPMNLENALKWYNGSWEDEFDSEHMIAINYGFAFERLCQGKPISGKPEGEFSRSALVLRCYFSSKPHPSFILSPLKVEVHRKDPFILQYHDFASDNEIQSMIQHVQSQLTQTSQVFQKLQANNNGSLTSTFSSARTSANAWIDDMNDPLHAKLLKKIARTINITTDFKSDFENRQIAAYNPGGHYAPHVDAIGIRHLQASEYSHLDEVELQSGDRILTFMIYLSDVEEGGGTAFPVLKTYVKPKKGSAVFWFNLKPDGSIDYRTLHGGCSVVVGNKYISNTWIRSHDQMFLKKCPASNSDSWSLEDFI